MSNKYEHIDFYLKTRSKHKDYAFISNDPTTESWFDILSVEKDSDLTMIFTYHEIHGYILSLKNIVGNRKDFENRPISYHLIFRLKEKNPILKDLIYAFLFNPSQLIKQLDSQEDLILDFFAKDDLNTNQSKHRSNLWKIALQDFQF
jgi:hypothetical protein